jgi:hypothetical protein
MRRIRRGVVPEEMEDKWFVYWQDDSLFFHRSWTGFCIYVVRFIGEGDSCKMVTADLNRDPEQHAPATDAMEARMISYLIDVLLLRQASVFPSDEPGSDKEVMMQWTQVGRAMLGEHPKGD